MTHTTTMQSRKRLSADDIRQALIARIETFCRLTGISRNELGIAVLNDHHAIRDIENGRNISLRTYERLSSHMDKKWPHQAPSLAGNLEKENG